MKIQVSLDPESAVQSSSEAVAKLVGPALGHLAGRLSRTEVTIRQVLTSQDEEETLCRMTAHLLTGEAITVSERHAAGFSAVEQAVERLHAALEKIMHKRGQKIRSANRETALHRPVAGKLQKKMNDEPHEGA